MESGKRLDDIRKVGMENKPIGVNRVCFARDLSKTRFVKAHVLAVEEAEVTLGLI